MPATVPQLIQDIRSSLPHLAAEMALVVGLALVLVTGLIRSARPIARAMGTITLLVAIVFTLNQWQTDDVRTMLFNGMLTKSNFTLLFVLLIDVAAFATILLPATVSERHRYEYVLLLLSATIGAHFLVMSTNLVMIFLSLELVSISSYLLTGFLFDKRSSEGSLKYFLFGAAASAVMMYGMSWLYGLTGTLSLQNAASQEFFAGGPPAMVIISGALILAGFLYKVAAVPMHLWSPDVYEAAPVPIVAFFSVVPKSAGLAVLMRFVSVIQPSHVSGIDWRLLLAVVAILTIIVGNFSALWQTNAKRLMAYSSIAQSGFLLLGLIVPGIQSTQALLYYVVVYAVGNYLVFVYLSYFETQGVKTIADFAGEGKTQPVAMIFLLTGLISLTGLPPTGGFIAKLLIFSSLWTGYSDTHQTFLLVLVVMGLLNTVVSLFYYLRIPYFAFIKAGNRGGKANIITFENLFGAVLVLLILCFFFSPELLMGWINKITFVR